MSFRAHAAWIGLLIAGSVIAFLDVVGAERGLFFRDTIAVFKPLWSAAIEALRAGELPAMTHWSPSGVPIEQSWAGALFTPATAVLFLARFDVAYDLFVLFHVIALAIGAYALAVRLGALPHEAAIGAGIAALSGPILSLENLVVALQGIVWLPWATLGAVAFLQTRRPIWLALLAGALACHLQALLPEIVLFDALLAAALLIHLRDRLSIKALLGLAAATVAAAAVAAIDLVPVLAVLSGTRRGSGFGLAEAQVWAFHPAQIVDLIAPSFWFSLREPSVAFPSLTGGPMPYLTSLYLGAALGKTGDDRTLLGQSRRIAVGMLDHHG